MTTTEAATFQRWIQGQGAWHKTFTRPNYLWRFRYLIERSEWDDVILAQEKCINWMCIGVIIVAAFYFVPLVLTILFLGQGLRDAS